MGRLIPIPSGQRFGKLVTSDKIRKRTSIGFECFCLCDCGKAAWIRTCDIMSGHVQSCGCKRTKDPIKVARNIVLDNYKRNAHKRRLVWSLPDDVFDDLINQQCFYCDRSHSNIRRIFTYNGIDRINNDMGYTIDNVIPCCIVCNRAKNNMTFNEFEAWLKDIGIKYGTK